MTNSPANGVLDRRTRSGITPMPPVTVVARH